MDIKRKIKVLVVDDSIMFREVMVRGLEKDPGIDVVGVAANAYEASDKIIKLQPDVLTLDIEMPKISGVDFLRQLMPQYPLPVVMVSGVTEAIFDALKAGAVDFVNKPDASRHESMESFINEMIIKIKIASTAKVGHLKKESSAGASASNATAENSRLLIAIGASTGGTEATLEVIKELPRDVPPIVIVQHMPPVFTKMYADRLNNVCKIEVKEAADGDRLLQGRALIAPGGYQLRVIRNAGGYFVKVFEGDKVNGHSPSVDVLFDSVADAAKGHAIGVILTGMGNDGAKGMLQMHNMGAYTIGQDEKSCVVYGMPMVAYNLGGVDKQCALTGISAEILKALKSRRQG
jgi:two-component system, chemotaxis family, protein-glutamate methylesterase/glutaminase